jgi:hypothetical protein
MFCNIRHLSLSGGLVRDMSRYGLPQRRFGNSGSRALFLICTFFAFAGLRTQLQTLEYDVIAHQSLSPPTTTELHLTFWPLKLLAGHVKVTIPSVPKEIVDSLDPETNDLDLEVIEACQRFALCYFSHKRPLVGNPISLESITGIVFKNKMDNLMGFRGLIDPDNIQRLMDLVKRMEWMEVEQLDHAEEGRSWSLNRAWLSRNGSPPQKRF